MTKFLGTKETAMKFKVRATVFALAFVLAAGSVTYFTGAASVSADSKRHGELHATMDCSAYTGDAGDFCILESSNLYEIKVGSKQFMDQAAGTPAGMLDSNVVFDAGTGDWAVGRCTLDLTTALGLCTFSDGTGPLAGFHARVNLSPAGEGKLYWDGTYSFSGERD
jgi:hypothetical protein